MRNEQRLAEEMESESSEDDDFETMMNDEEMQRGALSPEVRMRNESFNELCKQGETEERKIIRLN